MTLFTSLVFSNGMHAVTKVDLHCALYYNNGGDSDQEQAHFKCLIKWMEFNNNASFQPIFKVSNFAILEAIETECEGGRGCILWEDLCHRKIEIKLDCSSHFIAIKLYLKPPNYKLFNLICVPMQINATIWINISVGNSLNINRPWLRNLFNG